MDENVIKRCLDPGEEILFSNFRKSSTAQMIAEVKTITSEFEYKYYLFFSNSHEVRWGEIEIADNIYEKQELLQYEIWRIYKEFKVTQLFLGQIFNMSRSKISLLLKDIEERNKKYGKVYKTYSLK